MTDLEQQLLLSEVGELKPALSICSGTQIDAGRWWRQTPLWVCLLDSDVVVFAVARRRYIQRVSIADCADSFYCHGTGELVIGPAEELTFNRFAMSPMQAVHFLDAINQSSVISDVDVAGTVPAAGPVAAEDEAEEVRRDDESAEAEVAGLLASAEFTDAFSEEELAEFKKMSPEDLLAMLEEDDDCFDDDE